MSIYATFFVLADDEDHDPDCARYRTPSKGEIANVWFNNGRRAVYDDTIDCSCEALGAPYRYYASHGSITGPDHERVGHLMCCGAVGTHTVRLSLPEYGPTTVLLDERQVTALRDALTRFLEHWDDPTEYGRAGAYDAVPSLCPTCYGTGLVERMATPDEVDNGCELGIAYDPCPQGCTP